LGKELLFKFAERKYQIFAPSRNAPEELAYIGSHCENTNNEMKRNEKRKRKRIKSKGQATE
jgi:hypothetical protein